MSKTKSPSKIPILIASLILLAVTSVVLNILLLSKVKPVIIKRDVSFDYTTSKITLNEMTNDAVTFTHIIDTGYSNPDFFDQDLSYSEHFATTTIIENSIPRMYVYDFKTKQRISVEDSFYALLIEDFKLNPTMNYKYFWHPTKENTLFVATKGLYSPSRLFVMNLNKELTELQLTKEITVANSTEIIPRGWLEPTYDNSYFLVQVVTKQSNRPNSGAISIDESYLQLFNLNGDIEE